MRFMDFMKKNLINYFIIVTGVTVAIAILGSTYDSSTKLGYEAFYSPLIIGVVAVLPSFVLYSPKELSFKQMFIRRILHFITLETSLIIFGMVVGLFDNNNASYSFAFSVFVVYLFVNIILWIIDSKTAIELNNGLKKLQDR